MTRLLDKAFEEASKLPAEEQDAFAKWMLDELASEKEWDEAFARTEDVLDMLADEALDAHGKGKTEPLEVDRL